MLVLKEINVDDIDKEYDAIKSIPKNENGNDSLKNGAGHIGYTILSKYRGNGYATAGLHLAIEKCKKIIPEDEIYLSVLKDNIASLKVQLNCGAYKVGETVNDYLTRIII